MHPIVSQSLREVGLRQLANQLITGGFLMLFCHITAGAALAQISLVQQDASVNAKQSSFTEVATGAIKERSPSQLNLLDGSYADEPQSSASQNGQRHGFIVRNLRRGLQDQKELYAAPFKVKNLKWDALFLGTTAALLATDRQVMRNISNDHVDIGHQVALGMLLGTAAIPSITWLYGLKTGDRHADETGYLTLESLANTFLIYTPMQFIAGRERRDEGTGNGRFWRHGGLNTSFPAGHPMFTWAMASVVAHEYPKTWVKVLVYGAAVSVSGARLVGRNHFPSDVWVGSILGYLIGTHIFHAHCDPQYSEACHR
jgi:membrane-associated phospholipid phosphatase